MVKRTGGLMEFTLWEMEFWLKDRFNVWRFILACAYVAQWSPLMASRVTVQAHVGKHLASVCWKACSGHAPSFSIITLPFILRNVLGGEQGHIWPCTSKSFIGDLSVLYCLKIIGKMVFMDWALIPPIPTVSYIVSHEPYIVLEASTSLKHF